MTQATLSPTPFFSSELDEAIGLEYLRVSPADLFDAAAIEDTRYRQLIVDAFQHYLDHIKDTGNVGTRLTATENLLHVQRMVQAIQANAAALRSMAIDVEALLAGVVLSDIGKGPPAMQALIATKREAYASSGTGQEWEATDFFKAFMNHEEYGMLLLEERAAAYALSGEEVVQIRRANAWHNGPGLRDSWWGQNYAEQMGGARYGIAEGREGVLHTILDRADGGSLYQHVDAASGQTTLIGGPKKIAAEVMTRDGDSLAEAIVGVFFRLPREACRQIEALRRCKRTGRYMGSAARARDERYENIFASAFVQEQISHLEDTWSLIGRIRVVLPDGVVKGCEDTRELMGLFAAGKVGRTSGEGEAVLHDEATRVLVDGVAVRTLDDLLDTLAAAPASELAKAQ